MFRTDISGYQPSPGDLAYPEKLEMMEAIANKEEEKQYQQSFNTPRNNWVEMIFLYLLYYNA